MASSRPHPSSSSRGLLAATFTIGVGLSGFFDGILLHQLLQWHHLLSLVPGETFRSIGAQIFADGMFHVAMYAVTAAGLWLLWRRRDALARHPQGWRIVAGGGLLGFGVWNVIDVAFFHWTLGIHRIRVDVPDPMAYDIGWLVILGLLPLIPAWLLLRRARGDGGGHGAAAGAALSLLALAAAPLASLPQPGTNSAIVLFRPGTSAGAALTAVAAADARILWTDRDAGLMALALDRPGATAALYRGGALLVTRSPALAGCAAALKL